jgi:hypothetical protein
MHLFVRVLDVVLVLVQLLVQRAAEAAPTGEEDQD